MAMMRRVDETTFARTVLAAAVPTVVLFGHEACSASTALVASLGEALITHKGSVAAGYVDVAVDPLLPEQYGVTATPTLVIFGHGEPLTRVVGFVPTGLLQVLLEQVARATLPRAAWWSPVEATLEDTVLLPLLDACELHYTRQVVCSVRRGNTTRSGRIDILLHASPHAQPCALIESKRWLRSEHELHTAMTQALGYARALELDSFIVAAPAGLWYYRRDGRHALLTQRMSSLTLATQPDVATQALRALICCPAL